MRRRLSRKVQSKSHRTDKRYVTPRRSNARSEFRDLVREFESFVIAECLKQNDGNVSAAARDLGLPLSTTKWKISHGTTHYRRLVRYLATHHPGQ